jgi:hypothetical protein
VKKKFVKKNALLEIEDNEEWREHWKGMPEFSHKDITPYFSIKIHFNTKESIKQFSELVGQNITENTNSIWYPKQKITHVANKRYIDESEV